MWIQYFYNCGLGSSHWWVPEMERNCIHLTSSNSEFRNIVKGLERDFVRSRLFDPGLKSWTSEKLALIATFVQFVMMHWFTNFELGMRHLNSFNMLISTVIKLLNSGFKETSSTPTKSWYFLTFQLSMRLPYSNSRISPVMLLGRTTMEPLNTTTLIILPKPNTTIATSTMCSRCFLSICGMNWESTSAKRSSLSGLMEVPSLIIV